MVERDEGSTRSLHSQGGLGEGGSSRLLQPPGIYSAPARGDPPERCPSDERAPHFPCAPSGERVQWGSAAPVRAGRGPSSTGRAEAAARQPAARAPSSSGAHDAAARPHAKAAAEGRALARFCCDPGQVRPTCASHGVDVRVSESRPSLLPFGPKHLVSALFSCLHRHLEEIHSCIAIGMGFAPPSPSIHLSIANAAIHTTLAIGMSFTINHNRHESCELHLHRYHDENHTRMRFTPSSIWGPDSYLYRYRDYMHTSITIRIRFAPPSLSG